MMSGIALIKMEYYMLTVLLQMGTKLMKMVLGLIKICKDDKRTEMPEAQFNAWCEVKADLSNKYGNMPVYGHREKGSSECPGANFPLNKVKAANFTNSNDGHTVSTRDSAKLKCL